MIFQALPSPITEKIHIITINPDTIIYPQTNIENDGIPKTHTTKISPTTFSPPSTTAMEPTGSTPWALLSVKIQMALILWVTLLSASIPMALILSDLLNAEIPMDSILCDHSNDEIQTDSIPWVPSNVKIIIKRIMCKNRIGSR